MENRVTITDQAEDGAAENATHTSGHSIRAALARLVSGKSATKLQSGCDASQTTDEVAKIADWSTMRPQVTSEPRNCRISEASNDTRLSVEPNFELHYLTLLTAVIIVAFLLSLGLSSQLPLMAHTGLATIDPTVKAFTFFFGSMALLYIVSLLRKPVRAIEFDKGTGVFWIEKRRPFGWKVGESAQMPIAQIHALQLLGYSDTRVHQNNTITEHELNVVFRNGTRVNLINHNHKSAIRSDATALSRFLGVPLWDGQLNS